MNFANVQSITIPEGDVKSIAIGGVTVWQKPNPLPYDAEVEYVEGTGVDTYIKVTNDTWDRFVARLIATDNIRAQRWIVDSGGQRCIYVNNSSRLAASMNADWVSTNLVPNGRIYEIEYNVADKKTYFRDAASGSTLATTTHASALALTSPEIFAYHSMSGSAYPGYMRLYGLRAWQSASLVRDFFPVRVGSAGALYDRANPTGGPSGNGLYGSATSTPLVAGPDKNGD